MDGVDGRQGVYVVAATNRPDMIDPALLRPGRLDKILYVPLPPTEGRLSILQALTRRVPLAAEVDLGLVGASPRLTGFSGADLAALVRDACVIALKEGMTAAAAAAAAAGADGTGGETQLGAAAAAAAAGGAPAPLVEMRHFELAMGRVQPSVSRKDNRMYEALRAKLRSARGHLQAEAAEVAQPSDAAGGGDGGEGATTDEPRGMEASADHNEPMEEEPAS